MAHAQEAAVPMLHDAHARTEITDRLQTLRPESRRRWGKMTVDQMVWHVNQWLLASLGQVQTEPRPMPLRFIVKPMVMNLPWPKGAATLPEFVAVSPHDFPREQDRCLRLVDDFGRRDLAAPWARHANFGPLTGQEWSRLQYKHLDHHLRQFGV